MEAFGCTDTVGGVSGALQGQLEGSLVSGPAGGQWAVGSDHLTRNYRLRQFSLKWQFSTFAESLKS